MAVGAKKNRYHGVHRLVKFGMPGHCDRFIRCVQGFRTFNSCPRNAVYLTKLRALAAVNKKQIAMIRANQYSSQADNGSMSKF